MELDNQETLTVIVALRLLQSLYNERDCNYTVPPFVGEILHCADCHPLSGDQIDDLCERINFG